MFSHLLPNPSAFLATHTLSTPRDIVVLADRNKAELDADVERALRGSGMAWVTRCGAPYSAKVRNCGAWGWWWMLDA